MHAHEEIIRQLYESLQRRDYRSMARCYHPEAHFKDEVFDLKGKQIGAMWHMLCELGKDMTVAYSQVEADSQRGSARWEARYTFSRTGRQVHNQIRAQFEFKDGKIYRHHDVFPFWRWSRMALGLSGLLLGWTPYLRNQVRTTAAQGLHRFMQKHAEYQ